MCRHQGLMIGMMKNNIATKEITPEIGRVNRILNDPCGGFPVTNEGAG